MAAVTLGAAMALGHASPAAAQGRAPLDLSAGYQFVWITGDQYLEGFAMPGGWTAGVSVRVTPLVSVVGEVNGSYSEGTSLHNVLAGARLGSLVTPQITGFGQVLTGLAHGSSGGIGDNGFNVQPGAGIDVRATDRIGLRLQGDYLIIRSSGITTNSFRFAASVVFDLSR